MYTNQSCYVKGSNEHYDSFNVSNGVKQGGVLSPLLFSCYIDNFFSQIEHSGLGCHVGTSYAGAFGYADDIALVAPSMQCFKKIIIICEKYANSHSITFNLNKSKLLCFNVDHTVVISQTYLNGELIPVVDTDKYLGNYISTNITDRNIIDNICDLYQRSNRVFSDFRVCDSNALDSLHRTYCMHMYGCELWDLNCNYIKDFKVAWRKIKRRIWRLPYIKKCKKCSSIAGWILRTFTSRDKTPMLTLFKSIILSRLDFGCQLWSPHQAKHINSIEKVQRSFTKHISGMYSLSYSERLTSLNLYSVQRRRERYIIIYVWKMLESKVLNFNPPVISLWNKRRGRMCVESHVASGHLGSICYCV